jgi:lipopolysaccharide transport system permease protein
LTRVSTRTLIRPPRAWTPLPLGEIWSYRELLFFLLWRDIKGNYRQMALGPVWIIIRPLLTMVIFSTIFGGLIKAPSDGYPYPLFFYSALLPWTYFSNALQQASNSLVTSMHLISKVYFPRLIIPFTAVLSGAVDALVSFLILMALTVAFGFPLRWQIVILPAFLLLAAAGALGVGLWCAALSVRFRDVSFVLGYAVQAWMYASPVVYSSSAVPEPYRFLYHLNPVAQVIDGFRWAVLGAPAPALAPLGVCVLIVLAVLATGLAVFQSAERTVVDLL